VKDTLIRPEVDGLPVAQYPVEVRLPQEPVKTSISSPAALLMLYTVTVTGPAAMLVSVNQRLLFTVWSPQLIDSPGDALAPTLVVMNALFAHSGVASEQVSLVAEARELVRKATAMKKTVFRRRLGIRDKITLLCRVRLTNNRLPEKTYQDRS
jgi:hypothetical protein